jgi:type IV secretion system protein VirB1
MLELLMMCAPAVDPVTMAAVVKQESGGQPWVLNNNNTRKSATFESEAAAVAAAAAAMARGESVDMGLAQINSKNLPALGLSVDQAFDPCTNIAAGASVLATGYQKTGSLSAALSTYNTGRADSKVGAAYAQKVFQQAGVKVPGIPGGQLANLPSLPKLKEASSFAPNPVTMPAVRLATTPSPFAAGLSPVKTALQPAGWR